VSWDSSWW